jgi:hypothetical protein
MGVTHLNHQWRPLRKAAKVGFRMGSEYNLGGKAPGHVTDGDVGYRVDRHDDGAGEVRHGALDHDGSASTLELGGLVQNSPR